MKIAQGIFLLLLTGVLSVVALLSASAMKWAQELPSLDQLDALEFSATSEVYARDGQTRIGVIVPAIGKDKEPTNRIPVKLEEVSPAALEAIVAYEDDQFFRHFGFDLPGIAKATYLEFFGDSGRGGSTITTQVIKNTLLEDIKSERSLERKAKEIMLAIELERRLTKTEILQRYINVIFWGGNVYGIRAAAQTYFGKDPIQLNLAEGLYLARLIPSPNARHDDFLGTRASMREVLDKMVRHRAVSKATAERAWLYPLEPRGWDVTYDSNGDVVSATPTGEGVLVQASVSSTLSKGVLLAVRNWLTDRYGESVVFGRGGLRVTTTIDKAMQEAANQASLRANVPDGAQLALVGIDPSTGAVLAMVGQKLEEGVPPQDFNRVTQAFRQPGSSFKPVVYGTGVELGGLTQATVLVDEPTVFKQRGQEDYAPENDDHTYDGFQTVRANLDRSRNIPAVKALEAATPEAVAEKARELGYDVKPYYSLALGSFEATPLQHTAALAAFAAGGIYTVPYFIESVEDADGNTLYQAEPRRSRVWSEQTAYIMLDALHGNVVDRDPVFGFSSRAQIPGRWVAGKTGTTNDNKDIWFVGFTPGMVAGAWIGYDDPKSLPRSMTNNDGTTEIVTSSRQPIYLWKDFVENALRGYGGDPNGFPVPEGITFHRINMKTGALDPNGVEAAFRSTTDLSDQGFAPQVKLQLPIDKRTNKRATLLTPADQVELIEVNPAEVAQYLDAPQTTPQTTPPSTPGATSGGMPGVDPSSASGAGAGTQAGPAGALQP